MVRKFAVFLGLLVAVFYPVAVYVGLSTFRPGVVGLVLLLLTLARFAVSAGASPDRKALLSVARPVLPVVLLSGAAAVLDDARFLLWIPVIMSALFLGSFAATLRPGSVPLVERFARMRHPDLGPEQVLWCRAVTKVWCVFFVFNGILSAVLASSAPLEWWTLYCGFLAYLLMGALFAGEFVLRPRSATTERP